MASPAQKRYRTEDGERRPKKKLRKYNKQIEYHSSDESDEGESGQPRASDAPRGIERVAKKVEMTKGNAEPLGKRGPKLRAKASRTAAVRGTAESAAPARDPTKPRSILKRKAVGPESVEKSDYDEDDSDDGVDVDELERNTALNMRANESSADETKEDDELALNAPSSGEDEDDQDGEDTPSESESSVTSSNVARAKKKRNDPDAFAMSISKILDTKLSSAKRSDPVLSRSKSAAEANKTLADSKLEQKARAQIRAEKREKAEKGHVRDVLGLESEGVDTGVVMEEERRLKKTAQRGVVKLFNAVRAAQVKAEEALKGTIKEGVVGMQKREERVKEMSKQGFLDLISSGGGKQAAATEE